MSEDFKEILREIPEEAFQELRNPLEALSYLERIRWLQQTAYFIWKHKGAARRSINEGVPDPQSI